MKNNFDNWWNRLNQDQKDLLVFIGCFGWTLFPLGIIIFQSIMERLK